MRIEGQEWFGPEKTNPKACLSSPLLEKLTLVKHGEMENIRHGKMKMQKKEKDGEQTEGKEGAG